MPASAVPTIPITTASPGAVSGIIVTVSISSKLPGSLGVILVFFQAPG
jgi:hypothetical protein